MVFTDQDNLTGLVNNATGKLFELSQITKASSAVATMSFLFYFWAKRYLDLTIVSVICFWQHYSRCWH